MIGNDACGSHSVRWGTTAENLPGLEVITTDGVRRRVGIARERRRPPGAWPWARRSRPASPACSPSTRTGSARELPPWPRRVSGYLLDWLLPERGGDVARALAGTRGHLRRGLRRDGAARPGAGRPPPPRARLPGRHRGRGRRPRPAAGAPVHRREPDVGHPGRRGGIPGCCPPAAPGCCSRPGARPPAEARDHAARLAAAAGARLPGANASLVEDPAAQRVLWKVREDGAGRAARLPDGSPAWPGFEDAAVPPDRLAAYLGELRALLRDHGLRGHHVRALRRGVHPPAGRVRAGPAGRRRRGSRGSCRRPPTSWSPTAARCPGSTATAGRGASCCRGCSAPELLEAFGAWKAAWDPANRLNPGIIVDPVPLAADLRRPRPTLLAIAAVAGVRGRRRRRPCRRRAVHRRGIVRLATGHRGHVPELPRHRGGAPLHPRACAPPPGDGGRVAGRGRLAIRRGPGRAGPVPLVPGVRHGLPDRGGHGDVQGRVPRPPLPGPDPAARPLQPGAAAGVAAPRAAGPGRAAAGERGSWGSRRPAGRSRAGPRARRASGGSRAWRRGRSSTCPGADRGDGRTVRLRDRRGQRDRARRVCARGEACRPLARHLHQPPLAGRGPRGGQGPRGGRVRADRPRHAPCAAASPGP